MLATPWPVNITFLCDQRTLYLYWCELHIAKVSLNNDRVEGVLVDRADRANKDSLSEREGVMKEAISVSL